MSAVPVRQGEALPADSHLRPLPSSVEASLWRGSELGAQATAVVRSGWSALDAELPGGGWPTQSLTEVLSPQPSVAEWRLLGPALRSVVSAGGQVVVIGPPKHPHLPGLHHEGLDASHLVWIQAETPAKRLWVTEQLIKANAAGAVISWLPQARQEQIRRLQVCAQSNEGLVFLCRPQAAQHESSAAPLRVQVRTDLDWALGVQILKRRGPAHDDEVRLPSIPGGLSAIVTPRLRRPSALIQRQLAVTAHQESPRVVGRPAHRLRALAQ